MGTVPLIGITTADRGEELVTSAWYESSYSVPAQYVDAIRRAGGSAVLLPPGESDWRPWVGAVDGFVVMGGRDVAAATYGGDGSHPAQQEPQVDRDTTELALTRHIVSGLRPALFVCRGVQVLNIAMGGTLHPHIRDLLDEDMHRGDGDGDGWMYHAVEVEAGSQLAKAMDTEAVCTASGHHQAVDEIGEGLQVVARAADGIVEALEVVGSTWLVGVQWHPEVSAATDPSQQGLFDALVEAAQARHEG